MSKVPRRRIIKPGIQAQRSKLAKQDTARLATASELRRLFNDNHFIERATRGELITRILQEGHPSPPLAEEPECTKSQLIAYYDTAGKKLAEAHQYLRPDGQLGLGKRPDPKKVLHDDILYYIELQ